jgi:hypothetical protein
VSWLWFSSILRLRLIDISRTIIPLFLPLLEVVNPRFAQWIDVIVCLLDRSVEEFTPILRNYRREFNEKVLVCNSSATSEHILRGDDKTQWVFYLIPTSSREAVHSFTSQWLGVLRHPHNRQGLFQFRIALSNVRVCKEHSVSEMWSFSVLRRNGGRHVPNCVRYLVPNLLSRANLNHVTLGSSSNIRRLKSPLSARPHRAGASNPRVWGWKETQFPRHWILFNIRLSIKSRNSAIMSDYFPKQHCPNGLCNGDAVCLLEVETASLNFI